MLLAIQGSAVSVTWGAALWAGALVLTLPAARLEYLAAAGRDRERLQWIGAGAVLAAGLALAAAVLHMLVGWPAPLAATAAACTGALSLGLIAGEVRSFGPSAGRVLVQLIAVTGFVVLVAAVYMIVVLGVGSEPADASDRELLGLSMLAAAIAAVGYGPARERLLARAKHAVYGAREAPDEALRTFGNRLTRAIPMDELLLQLAESLRKSMALTSAEVYTGSGDVLDRAVSVPDAGPRSLLLTPRELPVVTRAGVSGSAWASVWLPALLDGRENAQLRVAPVSHAGQLLGLIVVERPAAGDSFTDEDDRVLTDLARQVGLAFHNAELDSALQNSLDELRAQAVALRESRARIVASGDAERRKLERNLHDGAQQNLVALAVSLRLARDVLADEPEAAGEMLDQLAADLKTTIQELRDLAHGIYPPLLADSGLGRGAGGGRQPQPARGHRARAGHRPVLGRSGGGGLLLLPGGPAERGQARAGRHRHDPAVGGVGRAAVRGRRRRARLRPGQCAPRARVHEHGRPARRHRRDRALAITARSGRHRAGLDPPALSKHRLQQPAPPLARSVRARPAASRCSHSRCSRSAPSRSLWTYPAAPLALASAGRSLTS